MIVLLDLLHIPLYYVLCVFAVIIVLGMLSMITLLVIREVKPTVREDPVLIKKWKRVFTVSAALVVIPILISWMLIYRWSPQAEFLEESKLFHTFFYYGGSTLEINQFFLVRAFTVMIPLGVLGMIALLIIRKVKPTVREDPALIKKWKRAFAFFAAIFFIPILVISSGT